MWAAEPHMEARKRIGFQVMIFLIVFAGLLYFTKKKVWDGRARPSGEAADLRMQRAPTGPLTFRRILRRRRKMRSLAVH